ncbi:non-specific serine/threonine protein kinase [Malassezia equina]|uniref:non-specific serine/threonine protein kinase n=1 Tax=Malassezia equina TaxID=1381935 RepID=A0AAF0E9X0_9BASI|nr:non-specific serine/threonine protein kinase [Malassezia equina]
MDEPGGEAPVLQLLQAPDTCLVKQGAEAKVYRAVLWEDEAPLTFPDGRTETHHARSSTVLIKHRFFKRYRHPALSKSITAQRTISEARSLVRSARSGVHVPRLVFVDETRGLLGMEWIEGQSVRQWLGGVPEEGEEAKKEHPSEEEQLDIMNRIGEQLGRMHCADVIHGDLTTSNMMLRPDGQIVLIDFGLASVSSFWEDKAVDLYVLERAFASTHPASEPLFHRVLASYAAYTTEHTRGTKTKGERHVDGAWPHIYARLQEVRLRGRKRSMVG